MQVQLMGARALFILKFPDSEISIPVPKRSQYTLMVMICHQDGNLRYK